MHNDLASNIWYNSSHFVQTVEITTKIVEKDSAKIGKKMGKDHLSSHIVKCINVAFISPYMINSVLRCVE